MRRIPSLLLAALLAVGTLLGLVAPAVAATASAPAPASSKSLPYENEAFVLSGDLGTNGVRNVTLQHHASAWEDDETIPTKSDGTYAFTAKTSKSEREFRVHADATATLPELTSDVVTVKTRSDSVLLVLSRNRSVGLAVGTAEVANPGRQWSLQIKDGSSWTQIGVKHNEGDAGAVRASFPIKSGSYRLVGDPVARGVDGQPLPGATSTKSFKKGPSSLGTHVLYAMTDSGKTPTKKGKDYTGTVGLDNDEPLPIETIAVRGNSSARYDKKPYKVKFIDSQSPFGLPKGKTFILLPNYMDHALVRNYMALSEASQLEGLKWTPHSVFTEVFLNGKYLGSYQLIESIKIQQKSKKNDARIDIDAEKGVVIEINPSPVEGAPAVFKGGHGMYYAFKDPDETKDDHGTLDPEGITPEKAAGMKTKIKKFESVLYGKNYKDPVEGWTKYLDVNSAVDFYLENEFIKNWDGDFFRSTFFYTNDYSDPNAKLFMGPIWDEDRSAGCKTSGTSSVRSPKGWWMDGSDGATAHVGQDNNVHTTHWFTRITNDKAFQNALKARWAQKKGTFKAIGDSGVDTAVSALGKNVAANDRDLWQSSQPLGRYLPQASSYAGEIRVLKKWYKARYKWMNGKLD